MHRGLMKWSSPTRAHCSTCLDSWGAKRSRLVSVLPECRRQHMFKNFSFFFNAVLIPTIAASFSSRISFYIPSAEDERHVTPRVLWKDAHLIHQLALWRCIQSNAGSFLSLPHLFFRGNINRNQLMNYVNNDKKSN